jgi:hypothetical protein
MAALCRHGGARVRIASRSSAWTRVPFTGALLRGRWLGLDGVGRSDPGWDAWPADEVYVCLPASMTVALATSGQFAGLRAGRVMVLSNGLWWDAVRCRLRAASSLVPLVMTMNLTRQAGLVRPTSDHGGLASPAASLAAGAAAGLGVPVTTVADPESALWSKFVVNAPLSLLPLATGRSPRAVLADEASLRAEAGLLAEVGRIAAGCGHHCVDLPGFPVRGLLAAAVAAEREDARPDDGSRDRFRSLLAGWRERGRASSLLGLSGERLMAELACGWARVAAVASACGIPSPRVSGLLAAARLGPIAGPL